MKAINENKGDTATILQLNDTKSIPRYNNVKIPKWVLIQSAKTPKT